MSAKFSAAERQALLLTVESLYLSGKTQADIADQIGVSQQQISKYLIKLQEAWLARQGERLESVKGRELARLDRLEREYWEAWARSCLPAEINVNRARTTTVEAYTEAGLIAVPALEREWTHTQRGQVGDPRFLEGVRNCIEMRLRIVGGFAPARLEVYDWRKDAAEYGVDPDKLVDKLTDDLFAKVTSAGASGTPPTA